MGPMGILAKVERYSVVCVFIDLFTAYFTQTNSFLSFNDYRIPREYLLNKGGDVSPEGQYLTPYSVSYAYTSCDP